jgi:hypothetical protein
LIHECDIFFTEWALGLRFFDIFVELSDKESDVFTEQALAS